MLKKMVKIVKIADMRVLSEDAYIGPQLTDVDTGKLKTLLRWKGRKTGYMPSKGKIATVRMGLKSGAWKLV